MDPQPQVGLWSSIVTKSPPSQPQPLPPPPQLPTTGRQLPPLKSREGISMAVVDANTVIEGGERLNGLADCFVTVPEVLLEIRDPVSHHRLALIPFAIHPVDPTPDALSKEAYGTGHLRGAPPPMQTLQVKRLPEKDLLGLGNNVPNLEEWEALETEEEHGGANRGSRILPVKDISLDVVDRSEEMAGNENDDGSVAGEEGFGERNRRYPPKKREVKIEGKMVAEGIDASKGEYGDDAGDWLPVVSRSRHRRFLRRKARREQHEAPSEKESLNDGNDTEVTDVVNGDHSEDDVVESLEQMRLEESTLQAVQTYLLRIE